MLTLCPLVIYQQSIKAPLNMMNALSWTLLIGSILQLWTGVEFFVFCFFCILVLHYHNLGCNVILLSCFQLFPSGVLSANHLPPSQPVPCLLYCYTNNLHFLVSWHLSPLESSFYILLWKLFWTFLSNFFSKKPHWLSLNSHSVF